MSEKIYRVQMNSKGMPNFSTAVEVADRPQDDEFKNFDRGDLIALIEAQEERIGELLADRPQGEWKPKNHHTDYCSNCGFEETQWRTADYNYCPNCGARMAGEEE